MEGKALEKSMKGMGTALREVGTKAIPSYVFHLMFVGQRRHGTRGIISVQGFVEKNEVGETAANTGIGFLE